MIAKLNDAQKSVHYPKDRRMFLGIKPYMLLMICFIVFGLIGAAWIQYLLKGLPPDPVSQYKIITQEDPKGFPLWINLSHWVNFFFLILIIRSGISILVDHPRLYWNN